jgi:hypothetical protein
LDWHPECAAGTAQPPPNVKITGARIDEDEIAAAFEIQGTHKGAAAEIDVYPDGTLGRDRAHDQGERRACGGTPALRQVLPELRPVKIKRAPARTARACSRPGTGGTARPRTASRSTSRPTAVAARTSLSPTELAAASPACDPPAPIGPGSHACPSRHSRRPGSRSSLFAHRTDLMGPAVPSGATSFARDVVPPRSTRQPAKPMPMPLNREHHNSTSYRSPPVTTSHLRSRVAPKLPDSR